MRELDTPEIHGYDPQAGYRVYTSKAIEIASADPAQSSGDRDDHQWGYLTDYGGRRLSLTR
jgi:arginine decarboxylase